MNDNNNNNKSIKERTSEYEKRFEISLEKLNIPKWLNIPAENDINNLRKTKSEYIINPLGSSNSNSRNYLNATTMTTYNSILQKSTTSLSNEIKNHKIPLSNNNNNNNETPYKPFYTEENNLTINISKASNNNNNNNKSSSSNWYKPKSLQLPSNVINSKQMDNNGLQQDLSHTDVPPSPKPNLNGKLFHLLTCVRVKLKFFFMIKGFYFYIIERDNKC